MAVAALPADEKPQRLTLFLGAGASVGAEVPATVAFLDEFRVSLRKRRNQAKLLRWIENKVRAWVNRVPVDRQLDIESVLEAITFLADENQVGGAFIPRGRGRPHSASLPSRSELRTLRQLLLDYIRERCLVLPEKTRPYDGFQLFLFDYAQIDIFTVNYDVVIEQLIARFGLQYSDGFRGVWDPNSFDDPARPSPRVNIFKLHGSATWFRSTIEGYLRLPIRADWQDIELLDGRAATPLMMYPAQKWEYAGPFLELLQRLKQNLESPDTSWLVVVGYSFRDEHLNRVFRDAVASNARLKIILIGPSSETTYSSRLARPEFGWVPDPGGSGPARVVSPLTGRVVRIPFAYETILQDFSRDWFNEIQRAIDFYERLRQASPRNLNLDWQGVAFTLVHAGITDLLQDVEARLSIPDRGEPWKVDYFGLKAIVQWSLGDTTGSMESWRIARSILTHWFSDALEVAFTNAPDVVQLLIQIKTEGPQNQLQLQRHGAMNIPQMLRRLQDLATRYAAYLGGTPIDPRRRWISEVAESTIRIETFCKRFLSPVPIETWVQMLQGSYPKVTKRVLELRQFWKDADPAKVGEAASAELRPKLEAKLLDEVRLTTAKWALRDMKLP